LYSGHRRGNAVSIRVFTEEFFGAGHDVEVASPT
jgi:hypothetical protein